MPQINYQANFNGFELTAVTGLTVLSTNPYFPAKRKLTKNILARASQSKLASAFYTQRVITVTVGIARNTREQAEQSLDTLMNLIQGKEKSLILKQGGADRRYTCTYSDYNVTNSGGSYIELELMFDCSDSFGYETTTTTALILSAITTYTTARAITFFGGAETQAPTIRLTYTSAPGAGTPTVTIGNVDTAVRLTISRTGWANGDVVIIDCLAKTVTVNGSAVTYTGGFPEWASNNTAGINGGIYYADTLTSRQYGMTVTYNKRYV